jgi:DNA repair protein SbcC/Rad50
MKNFPRIYSISTVGIRQHNNADYNLHEIRTDFTGNNGLGKSILADLLQLIFVPLREEWRPGTEGIEDRKIENIPLKKDWIPHGFAFLNIEKKEKEFITIGVYIPRTSRLPVRPFIIQGGVDFESRGVTLVPFKHILESSDFIDEDMRIHELQPLARNLYNKYRIHFKDFYQRNQIDEYFELLFRNKLLPVDLTKEANLKSFAKVLQSFSRAKTLDTKKSKSLQDFLFEDNEAIQINFNDKKEILAQHIKNYHNADLEIRTLVHKQERLSKLKVTFEKSVKSKEEYLKNNAQLCFLKMSTATKEFNDNEAKQIKSLQEYNNAKAAYEAQCVDSYKTMLLQRDICNEIRTRIEDLKTGAGKKNLDELKRKLQNLRSHIDRLEDLFAVVHKYSTLQGIKHAYDENENLKDARKKLNVLMGHSIFPEFKTSRWSENYDEAYDFYSRRSKEIDQNLEVLKEIQVLYDGANPNSLFNWAVKQNKELSIEEETILQRLKEIYVTKVTPFAGLKLSLNPSELLSSYKKEGDGIWLNLGSLSEYLPLISKRLFHKKETLSQALAKKKEEIQEEISSLEKEKNQIRSLNQALVELGFNESYYKIYQAAQDLLQIVPDNTLSEYNVQFIEKNYDDFNKIKLHKEAHVALDEEITKIIQDAAKISDQFQANETALTELLTDDFHELKEEVTQPFDRIDFELAVALEMLIEDRNQRRKEIIAAEKYRRNIKSKRDEQHSTYRECQFKSSSLHGTKKLAEVAFAAAKQQLELETELRFENILILGEISDEFVAELKVLCDKDERAYELEYLSVANSFEESHSDRKNLELYSKDGIPYYSFKTLVNVLCGKVGLEGLGNELTELNEHLKSLGELQLKILTEVFTQVEKQYRQYATTILNLNFFFEKNKVSNIYNFKIEFEPRKDINIDWIEKMKNKARVHKYGADLFTKLDDMPSDQNSPENLIRNIARQFYSAVDADPIKLLDPKFYFTLRVKMEDEEGEANTASGGQAYTALALLCIGRLSIVQKDQDQNQGVKFIIIEELSNIDDTNFNIFPEIAKQFGYQLITMTPKPFGSYNDEEWYLHMLIKGKKDKYRNYTPMSFFKTRVNSIPIKQHLQQNELAGN